MGGCGGATESGIGGRMCDGVLGFHVTGVTVYRETTGKTTALGPVQAYRQCSSVEKLSQGKLIRRGTECMLGCTR